jgi:hypothetical protein
VKTQKDETQHRRFMEVPCRETAGGVAGYQKITENNEKGNTPRGGVPERVQAAETNRMENGKEWGMRDQEDRHLTAMICVWTACLERARERIPV